MSFARRAPALAVLFAVPALLSAPSIARAESGATGADLAVFFGARGLQAVSGLEPALRAAGYGDLRTFDAFGFALALSCGRWRGGMTGLMAWGGAQSAAGRIGADLADFHYELGYDVVAERELLVSVLGGLGFTGLDVDARAPGWTLFANQLGSQDDPKRVSNTNVSGSLQVIIESFVPVEENARWGLTFGLRGGWVVPLGTFGWSTDESKPQALRGPAVDLGGEWLAVSVGFGGWAAQQ